MYVKRWQPAASKSARSAAEVFGESEASVAMGDDVVTTIDRLYALDEIAQKLGVSFDGAEDRACSHTWMQGQAMRGGDYLDHMALPNMHFHLTTAYAILRHNGVELGKGDYLGELPFQTKPVPH